MEIVASVGLGIALAVDASVVAFSCGISSREHTWSCPLKLALVTGAFQGVMPMIGFFATGSFVRFIDAWDHWVAFAVFLLLGATFIRNAWKKTDEPRVRVRGDDCPATCEGCARCAISTWRGVLAVGVATSIDALAVGAGIACAEGAEATGTLGERIFVPAAIITGMTVLCVWLAFAASRIFRSLPVRLLGTLAGLILMLLGVRAVLQ